MKLDVEQLINYIEHLKVTEQQAEEECILMGEDRLRIEGFLDCIERIEEFIADKNRLHNFGDFRKVLKYKEDSE